MSGVDLVDGTPVFDIKPYLRYADCVPDAKSGFADEAPPRIPVRWDCEADLPEETRRLIADSLSLQPQPAYHDDADASTRPRSRDGACDGSCGTMRPCEALRTSFLIAIRNPTIDLTPARLELPLRAALETIRRHGLATDRCEILQDGHTLVVRLSADLVARIVTDREGPRLARSGFAARMPWRSTSRITGRR